MTGTGSDVTGSDPQTGSDVTGSDPQTGSDVFWNGKPLSSWKKGSWAQEEAKPRRKRGLKVQSPILGRGVTWPRYGFDMAHQAKGMVGKIIF